MFTSIKIVSTFEENYFKKLSFLTKFVKENIKSIDNLINEILFRMQNSLV